MFQVFLPFGTALKDLFSEAVGFVFGGIFTILGKSELTFVGRTVRGVLMINSGGTGSRVLVLEQADSLGEEELVKVAV